MARAVAMTLALAGAITGCAVDDLEAPGSADPGGGGKADGSMPARSYEVYAAIVESTGATLGTRPVVLGLRGLSLDGALHDTSAGPRYDDTLVVLRAGQVTELNVSTHPWLMASNHVPDVNRDGAGDVGLVRPGRYSVVARPSSRDIVGQPTFHVTVAGADAIPAWRDTDHDGVISDLERTASESRGDLMTAILFHVGGDAAPAAVGCQVQAADSHRRFVAALGGRVAFDYVLVDASDYAAVLQDLPE
jgi:hypothetical protein